MNKSNFIMKFSGNTLALFLCLTAAAHAFVQPPPLPLGSRPITITTDPITDGKTASYYNTELRYIKEGYDTGIGPDFLKNQKRPPTIPRRRRKKPVGEINIEDHDMDDIIDAVVISEHYVVSSKPKRKNSNSNTNPESTERKPFVDDKPAEGTTTTYDAVAVDSVVENLKRNMSSKSPRDVFPDLHQHHHQQQQQPRTVQTTTAPEPRGIWDSPFAKTVQGGSLQTWSIDASRVQHTQVLLKPTEAGTPLRAQVDVWNGPGHAPMKMAIYCAANTLSHQPFSCIVPTPWTSNVHQSIGIKNSGPMEFPMEAVVVPDADSTRGRYKPERQQQQQQTQTPHQQFSEQFQQQQGGFYNSVNPNHIDVQPKTSAAAAAASNSRPKPSPSGLGLFVESLRSLGEKRRIDGHSPVDYIAPGSDPHKSATNEEVFRFEENVDSVQVLIETNGLSCQTRIEVTYDIEDDETIQQVIELSIEDGKERPFFAVIDTPLACPSTVRIVNLDPYSAFPLMAYVEPYTISSSSNSSTDDGYEEEGGKAGDEIIDANIDANIYGQDGVISNNNNKGEESEEDEEEHYSFPDITIPLTDMDYEFEEEFFFAKRE